MVFSSFVFLLYFLPVTTVVYYITPRRWRNLLLLIVSLGFYAWGEPLYLFLMIASTFINYSAGILISKAHEKNNNKQSRLLLIISLIINLGMLCFFKYTDFIIGNINNIFDTAFEMLRITLPIGISFYTFQTLSYIIDVYRGNVSVQRNFIYFAMYISFFPQLIAGPIVRYSDIETQLGERRTTPHSIADGLCRFIIGLGKKVILANQAGALYETVFAIDTGELTAVMAWTGAAAFMFHIYYDFSGYSDMAIGLCRMFGFNIPENFNYPYTAKSITDFWRRWHITLSSWFREYLYIPLGGNRRGLAHQLLNLFIVWTLTGLWHGAGWTFLFWGVYYFVILAMEKLFLGRLLDKLPSVIGHVYSILVIIFGWIIFASENITLAFGRIYAMFGQNAGFSSSQSVYELTTHIFLFMILIIGSTRFPLQLYVAIQKRMGAHAFILKGTLSFAILFLCIILLVGDSYNPFLYFRF